MTIILDTSAAVEIVLRRRHAVALTEVVIDADLILSPKIFIPEVTNVFWKYYQFSDMSMEQCEAAIDRAISIPDEYCDELEMVQEAFALGCLMSRPVYDMFFLVLARRNNGSLLTMDARLKETAQKASIRVV